MSALDLGIVGLYSVAVLGIGFRAGRGHQSPADLVLASRRMPGWAVLGSMVATELSAATFVGVPHVAYTGDWSYLQLAFGALLGKAILAWRVIPLYHRLGVETVYGFLEERFGPRTRRAAALCFVGGRVLASGARLFIAALALSVATGLGVSTCIVLAGLLAGAYTLYGGIRSVIWTDTLQAAVFLLAAGALLFVVAGRADGGLLEVWEWAHARERMRILHLEPLLALGDARPFAVGVLGGLFLTLATHGTDYDMVQRLLAARDGRSAGRALLGSAILNFPLTVLFLAIGTSLAFFYATSGHAPVDPSQVLPSFALGELPAGLRGLLFAGLLAAAMSSLDSALCALATTWVVDVRPALGAPRVARLRRASLAFAGLLVGAALAMAAYHRGLSGGDPRGAPSSLVELALAAMTILYGGLLGVFALGLLGRTRGDDRSARIGLLVGGSVGLALFLHPLLLGRAVIAWPWWIPLGAFAALATAALRPSPGARFPSRRGRGSTWSGGDHPEGP